VTKEIFVFFFFNDTLLMKIELIIAPLFF